jgi:hypothetical protein
MHAGRNSSFQRTLPKSARPLSSNVGHGGKRNQMKNGAYDQFPMPLALFCVLGNLLIYIVGALLLAPLGKSFVALYILYCLGLEIRVLRISCRDCFYYGKLCAFGRGKMCSVLFKKGSPEKFMKKKISWSCLLPDFLASLIPLSIGGFFLAQHFSWLNLFLVVFLIFIAFPVTGFIRSSIACKHCKQKDLGCPSIIFFSGNKQHV